MSEPALALDGSENRATSANSRGTDVVYTALFGRYESLVEEERALDSDAEFICFTDDPSLTSETWRVELIEPRFPMDPIRSARWVKIFGEEAIWRGFERSLWVDNRVTLKTDPKKILDSLLEEPRADIALFEHSFRHRVIDEFDAVVEGGYDDPGRVYEQLLHYAETSPEVLDERPLWTGLMARRHNDQVVSAMRTWAAHVCRYSRRDQLSVNLALHDRSLCVRRMDGDNRDSEWHAWPPLSDALDRQGKTRSRVFEQSIRAPLARLRAVEREHHDLLEAHAISAARRDKVIAKQRTRTDELQVLYTDETRRWKQADAALAKSQARVARLIERVERLRRRVAILEERSGLRPKTQSRPIRAPARRLKTVGRRLAVKARAKLHG